RAFTSYSFKPQLKTVGPKYGKQLANIRKALSEVDGNAAMDTLNEKGQLTFSFDGTEVVLTKDDLLIDMAQTEGYVSEGDNAVTVVLDTRLTPELLEEGFYRELVSKLQTMRKEAGFEVMDHIHVYADQNETLFAIIRKYSDALQGEVLADGVTLGETAGYVKEWNINGESVVLGVKKCPD
ncbi:MAG: isoleucine--tRNA ligase, partial [Lachnospiraceae bacterium]|nr:isoleucine--tRNA ligase [Lachnospiraceae bacterium]